MAADDKAAAPIAPPTNTDQRVPRAGTVSLLAPLAAPVASPMDEEEADVCPICLSPPGAGPNGLEDGWHRLKTCGHSFHASCIMDAYVFDRRCPVCRHDPSADSRRVDHAGEQGGENEQRGEQKEGMHKQMASTTFASASASTSTSTAATTTFAFAAASTAAFAAFAPTSTGTSDDASTDNHRPSPPPCKGVYARRLFDDAGDNSLFLNEHVTSDAFWKSTEPVSLFSCKSCPLNCTNCKSTKPTKPCPQRGCPKDGVEQHEHRGFFKPFGRISCAGEGYKGSDQCRRCQWLEASTGKDSLWQLLELEGTATKGPLHRQAIEAEKKRLSGEIRKVSSRKRDDLKTASDWRTLYEQEKGQRENAEHRRDVEVATACKSARKAARHQSTAEQVAALATAERDQARANTERALHAAGVAEVELVMAQTGKAAAHAAADASAQALKDAQAAALANAQELRERHRAELEASERHHAGEQREAAEKLAAAVGRLNRSELHAVNLQTKLTSTLSEVSWRVSPAFSDTVSSFPPIHRSSRQPMRPLRSCRAS